MYLSCLHARLGKQWQRLKSNLACFRYTSKLSSIKLCIYIYMYMCCIPLIRPVLLFNLWQIAALSTGWDHSNRHHVRVSNYRSTQTNLIRRIFLGSYTFHWVTLAVICCFLKQHSSLTHFQFVSCCMLLSLPTIFYTMGAKESSDMGSTEKAREGTKREL